MRIRQGGVCYLEILLVGLGKMGLNLALNLMSQGCSVIGYDVDAKSREEARKQNIFVLEDMGEYLMRPSEKVVWLMVPSGDPTQSVVDMMLDKLGKGDILIEAGNSHYKDSMKRAALAHEKGIDYLDVGTSGGISGARYGACLMVGGKKSSYEKMEKVFERICVDDGCMYAGASGSGHFLKMIHNGVEYGMMQSIGEGFQIVEESEFDYDLEAVAKVWNHGSVVRSWLMELAQQAFAQNPHLKNLEGIVSASGEAKWTVETALEMEIAAPVITLSLMMRNLSQDHDKFSAKVVSALRNGFGGHAIVEKKEK